MASSPEIVDVGGYGKRIDLVSVPIRLTMRFFELDPEGEVLPASLEHGREMILAIANISVRHARWQMIFHQWKESVYDGGVRYFNQSENEDWQDPLVMRLTKKAKCDSLAVWRVAELINSGVDARPDLVTNMHPVSFHLRVWRKDLTKNLPPYSTVIRNGQTIPFVFRSPDGNGYIEDVSLFAGMGLPGRT